MGQLEVQIVSARNLANKDGFFGKNDVYAIVKIGHFNKHRTRTHNNAGANCDFNEIARLDVKDGHDIEVEVWDADTLRDDLIGKCKIPLNLIFQQGYVESWYAINEGAKNNGEILLKIRTL
ncbi:hypothetical protein CONCODRAFT_85012 [Conidiobolus coronatus NRRL 28638]|uniref:C2 domain-containing protein n=1 Tax=Conidiobolus coronatus (strain ATCC 28846 / CBS 209.66 / NRRL 28638) TaxID=796925 RepID=A0A137P7D7_CONC2|nr:hypothetical protein CONCODRAFT_85012 [Conidiobolus coronatus NRRL 28638]|eukprot:KXN70879.1 hypothetical protein CONCODRAFT_85012 [Conidiobolus coronatus NRRL 28638]